MEESNEENTFQNKDKDVTKPETFDVKTVEVTEEPLDIDLEKNVVENIGDIQGEESQRTEIEPNTQPMTNHSENEDSKEAVGFKWSISCCL